MNQVIQLILSNPLILGAIIQMLLSALQQFLTQVDESGVEQTNASWLHNTFLVLSFLAAAANLASQGQLGHLDLTVVSDFLNYWVPLFISGKASSVIIQPKPTTTK